MSETIGDFFDGQTSRQHRVTLRFDKPGYLLIDMPDGVREYPLDQIQISSRLGNTSRSLYLADGAKCEVTDNDFVDELIAPRRGGMIERMVHMLESRLNYVLSAVVFTVATVWGMATFGIPALAEKAAYAMPISADIALGKGALKTLDETLFEPSGLEPCVQERLQARFSKMIEGLDQGHPYRLEFRDGGLIGANAFALPSGIVVMTDQLVELAENDEGLISVLAHEIGHIVHRHSLRHVLQNSGVALLMASVLGDVGSISALSAALPTMLVQLKYSRAFETEADDYALAFLATERISPHHFADMLSLLQGDPSDEDDGYSYLSTHPSTHERIGRVRDYANYY